jgi:hypothetical protein
MKITTKITIEVDENTLRSALSYLVNRKDIQETKIKKSDIVLCIKNELHTKGMSVFDNPEKWGELVSYFIKDTQIDALYKKWKPHFNLM